jgi:hypothetical protein
MGFLKTAFIQFSEKKYAGFVIVLLCFLVLRLIAAFTFYNGFILNFPKIAEVFNPQSSLSEILLFVPFHSFSICLSSLLHPLFLIAVILVYIPVIYKKKYVNFNRDLFLKHDKVIVFVTAFILSWEICTYDYNYYLNSAFYFDRILLLTLPFLLFRFPILTPLYIAFAYVYRSQFNYPVDGFELFDKRLLFDILLMYVALAYVKIYFKKANLHFVYLVLCIIASNYFISGVSKITMSPRGYEWLLYNNLSDLFLNVHARGWLCNYDNETIKNIGHFLSSNSVLLQSIILILELAALLLLKNIRVCIALLVLLCGMHFGIFLVGSMLFWKWMVIDIVLAIVLWTRRKYFEEHIFNKKIFSTSILIIFSSVIWLRPYTIGWFDTKVNQYFTYEVEDVNGKIAEVSKNELNPYHQWFQYDRFVFLLNKKCLPVSGFGYTNQYRFKARLDTALIETIPWLQAKYGINHYDSLKYLKFNNFIQTFFTNRNNLENPVLSITKFSPPHHLNNCVYGVGLPSLGKVKKFRVLYNISYNEKGEVLHLIKQVVDEIHI